MKTTQRAEGSHGLDEEYGDVNDDVTTDYEFWDFVLYVSSAGHTMMKMNIVLIRVGLTIFT